MHQTITRSTTRRIRTQNRTKTQQAHAKRVKWPSVSRLTHLYGIDQQNVAGSGPHDIVTKGDVLSYVLC